MRRADDEAAGSSSARPYRSTLRAERAAETRRTIAVAARELFAERGFPGTTVTDIAERARVAAQTVYATFGSKGAIVRALLTQFEVDAEATRWRSRIEDEPDPGGKLEAFAQWTCALLSSSKSVIAAVQGAAGDPALLSLRRKGTNTAARPCAA